MLSAEQEAGGGKLKDSAAPKVKDEVLRREQVHSSGFMDDEIEP